MSKHTPGPWRVHGDGIGVGQSPRGQLICRAAEVYMNRGEREANARLVAAAPDLLKACQDVLDAINNTDLGGEVIWIGRGSPIHESASDRLEAVIAQATGEEPK